MKKMQSEAEIAKSETGTRSLKDLKDKIILLQDVNTLSITCDRCHASANNSNEIKHKSCCPYIWGPGC